MTLVLTGNPLANTPTKNSRLFLTRLQHTHTLSEGHTSDRTSKQEQKETLAEVV